MYAGRRKGWRVIVVSFESNGPSWRLNKVWKTSKTNKPSKSGLPYKYSAQLNEREARKAIADYKRDGLEARLVNPEGETVLWVNKV